MKASQKPESGSIVSGFDDRGGFYALDTARKLASYSYGGSENANAAYKAKKKNKFAEKLLAKKYPPEYNYGELDLELFAVITNLIGAKKA